MAKIKFGTDGWRAVIAEDFTFENLSRVAQATASYWNAHPVAGTVKKAVVGYDRRFLSDQFAQRTAEILAANGFAVTLTNTPTPTPAVSWTVKQQRGIGGVMLTASHNPAIFNGFKLKAHFGGSAPPEVCSAVEALLDAEPVKSVPFADA
ncbi:MAG: phosphoglucomutase/phosphomannomutase family protein, partial [Limisphaerales bacterium]